MPTAEATQRGGVSGGASSVRYEHVTKRYAGMAAPAVEDLTLEVAGTRGGSLLVRVCAAPAENRANQALVRLLAKRLGVGRGRVELVSGRRSREKVLRVRGLSAAEVATRLR